MSCLSVVFFTNRDLPVIAEGLMTTFTVVHRNLNYSLTELQSELQSELQCKYVSMY